MKQKEMFDVKSRQKSLNDERWRNSLNDKISRRKGPNDERNTRKGLE